MSMLLRLRKETAKAHSRMEEEVQIEKRLGSPEEYRELLATFHGFYGPMETRFLEVGGWGAFDPADRRKTPWLEKDLAALGLSEGQIEELPVCLDVPEISDTASCLGAAYVLEGATLGGRHISGWLKKSDIPESARNFFGSYGDQVGARWQGFCETLNEFGAAGGDEEKASQAANETFASLERWMKAGRLA